MVGMEQHTSLGGHIVLSEIVGYLPVTLQLYVETTGSPLLTRSEELSCIGDVCYRQQGSELPVMMCVAW